MRSTRLIFLPGAAGSAEFWKPVGSLLPPTSEKVYLSWPGLGDEPHDPTVNKFDDLVELVKGQLGELTDLVAQSFGGAVAIQTALGNPVRVRRIVLVAASVGLDLAEFGAREWRSVYEAEFPAATLSILDSVPDLRASLCQISQPTLLIWGDQDPISPVAVGEELARLIPQAQLEIVAGGDHALAREQPLSVARLIASHLA